METTRADTEVPCGSYGPVTRPRTRKQSKTAIGMDEKGERPVDSVGELQPTDSLVAPFSGDEIGT